MRVIKTHTMTTIITDSPELQIDHIWWALVASQQVSPAEVVNENVPYYVVGEDVVEEGVVGWTHEVVPAAEAVVEAADDGKIGHRVRVHLILASDLEQMDQIRHHQFQNEYHVDGDVTDSCSQWTVVVVKGHYVQGHSY